jgi:rhodanese-related sulfurtransferase
MFGTISRSELKQKMDRGDLFTLVEILPETAYQHEHLPGAINLPPDRVKESAPQVLPDKGAEIIVYCASFDCDASDTAAGELVEMGYTNVKDYAEGKSDWIEAGYPTESAHKHHKA